MDQHDLIVALKDLALELGRSPNRAEFCARVTGGEYKLGRIGGFSALLQSAGLPTYSERRRKVKDDIFERPLEPFLKEQHERQADPRFSNFVLPVENYPTTVIFGDIHEPFSHEGAKAFAIEVVSTLRPVRAIQIGDARDLFSWQKYPRSHNVFTPKEEVDIGTSAISKFWSNVQAASPGIECFQLLGNHDIRPYKRVLEACPELEMFIDLRPLYTFPGVTLIEDPRHELELDGVFFHHGYRTKLGDNRDFMNACSVTGHSHRGGVVYRSIWGGHMIWELNAGTLGDPTSKGLSYTNQKHTQQTLGVGIIDKFGPRFIPYQPKRK